MIDIDDQGAGSQFQAGDSKSLRCAHREDATQEMVRSSLTRRDRARRYICDHGDLFAILFCQAEDCSLSRTVTISLTLSLMVPFWSAQVGLESQGQHFGAGFGEAISTRDHTLLQVASAATQHTITAIYSLRGFPTPL